MHPKRPIKIRALLLSFFLLLIAAPIPSSGFAQSYYFSVPELIVNVYWNDDGTSSIDYLYTFTNDPGSSPIDVLDVGAPNASYDLNSVQAWVDGQEITDIERSPYVQYGVAVNLGSKSIQPGDTGQVRVYIARVYDVLYPDDQDPNYTSAVFIPSYLDKSIVHGLTDVTVLYHFPPGVQPEEPRWHPAPAGFPSEPESGFDDQDRVVYSWRNTNANAYTPYKFGASFPNSYVPASAIVQEPPPSGAAAGAAGGVLAGAASICSSLFFPLLCIGMVILFIFWAGRADRQRKLQYLPPKVSIEGHGIKRGLTAVEAAILMEQPVEKVMTMILFGVLKKNAARVTQRDPLQIEVSKPLPEKLYPYETDFLAAFEEKEGAPRKKALQKTMVDLVKSIGEKMKGFSRKETLAYYQDIIKRAWAQVEAADTPEVKSAKFDEVIEWTMLDKDYDDRTREVFHGGPVFVPVWWPRYDPTFGGGGVRPTGVPAPRPGSTGAPTLPTLPGSEFAAGIVLGVQNFSTKVVGNITDFTRGITNITNPPPPPPPSSGRSFSSGRGGSSCACACACACAGCACACAGGGR